MSARADQQFGKYQLLERLAAGGMAEIYRAKYTAAAGVTKPVVIKKILPHYAGNRAFISMFINEAKITVGLSHGNIAQVFDFGEIDGEYYLAMEWVHGQPLSKVLKRARGMGIPVIPTPFAVLVAIEVSKGLHYAHTRLDEQGRALNIIHRDISPQNLLLAYEGQVKIVDFGIAKARIASLQETQAGAVKGKYVYFSPEQARGKDLDARCDIFATGIVLYEMLCGRLPFEGKMIEVLSKIVRGEFPKPRALNPDITPALERILLTAMAHERNDRYPNAEAFREALAAYLYTHAPTFSSNSLGYLMTHLFEQELLADGQPVQLPREFLEQVPLWKKVLPSPHASALQPTKISRPKLRPPPEKPDDETHTDENPDPRWWRRRQTLMYGAVPLAAMLIGLASVVAIDRLSTFEVQLTSDPAGAAVKVDGQPATAATPLAIKGLSSRQPHRLEVTAPGMKPWSREVPPQRGGSVELHVVLDPDRPPLDLTAEPARVEPPAPSAEDLAESVRWPVRGVQVVASRHAVSVPASGAARMRLEPSKSYRVWAEESLSIAGSELAEVFYFLEGSAVPAREAFGLLGQKPVSVRRSSALYAFVVADVRGERSGAVKLRIQEKGGAVSTLLVDPREHAVAFGPRQRFTVTRLDGLDTYQLVVRGGAEAARLHGRGGAVGKVAASWEGGARLGFAVFEVGKRYTVSGAERISFFFPDDSVEDNSGSIELELAESGGEAARGP